MGKIINPPEVINAVHDLTQFESGEATLDHWLKHRALKNHQTHASKTFVVTTKHNIVIAYYCLAAGSVDVNTAPGKVKRNMPNPIPVIVLGRLAVSNNWQAQGLGSALLKNALLRTLRTSHDVGMRALLVHAISDSAVTFYKQYGFIESPIDPMTLMLPIQDIKKYL